MLLVASSASKYIVNFCISYVKFTSIGFIGSVLKTNSSSSLSLKESSCSGTIISNIEISSPEVKLSPCDIPSLFNEESIVLFTELFTFIDCK